MVIRYIAPMSAIPYGWLRQLFQRRKEILLVYLFGSVSKQTRQKAHDFDIAVLLRESLHGMSQLRYRVALGIAIEEILKEQGVLQGRSVDLILLNEADPLLVHQVVKYGQLLFERSHVIDRNFRVQAMTRYFDAQPLHQFFFQRSLQK